MSSGSPWSKAFINDLSEKEFRDEFVADQVRLRLASMIRALREQEGRKWSQSELGRRMGKAQNVVSRLEDPDYGKMSLATLLEVAAAFDLPLWVDMPEWGEWLKRIKEIPDRNFNRKSFNSQDLITEGRKEAIAGMFNMYSVANAASNISTMNVTSPTLSQTRLPAEGIIQGKGGSPIAYAGLSAWNS